MVMHVAIFIITVILELLFFELTAGDYSKSKIPHSGNNYLRIKKICSIMQKCIGKDYYSVKIKNDKFEVTLRDNLDVKKLSKYKHVIPNINYIIVTPRSTRQLSEAKAKKSSFLRLITKSNLAKFFNKSVDDIGKIVNNSNEEEPISIIDAEIVINNEATN